MTDEQIKKLAKEHTEDALEDWCTENGQIVEPWHCVVADLSFIAAKAIQNISKTHCIVEKDKVRAIYNRKTIPSMEDVRNKMIEECLIDALFGKELFNGKEE